MKTYSVLVGLLCAFSPMLSATVSFSVNPPGGAVSGLPGAITGWGFTLSNDTDYLVVNSATMIGGTSLGTFVDFISLPGNFTVIGLGDPTALATWIQDFDQAAQTGLGSFQINAGALPGDAIVTTVQISYDVFSVSPLNPAFNPDTDAMGSGTIVTAVSVSVDAPAGVPEPSTVILVGAGLLFGFRAFVKARTCNS
jgi:PEP-CTERM motif